MTIRPYTPEDCEPLIEVFRTSVRRKGIRDYSLAQVTAWAPDEIDPARWNGRRLSRPTWVAELDGNIVGFSDLEPDGHVDMLFVDPDFQGRGVASVLLQFVESVALKQGLKRLYAEASIGARPVFERAGFRVIAPQTVVIRGQSLTNYRMEKML